MLITVAELPEYQRRAQKLLSEDEQHDIVSYLAAFPKDGDLIRSTGGVRKLRWRRSGRGKSGGVRVIYYFHSERMPLYLLTVFAKNERADLSRAALQPATNHMHRRNGTGITMNAQHHERELATHVLPVVLLCSLMLVAIIALVVGTTT